MKNIFQNSNIKNEQEFQICMTQIQSGYIDCEQFVHFDVDNEFKVKYILQSPEMILKTKRGICWDQVELEREYFISKNINCESYYIVCPCGDNKPNHTFLIYENDGTWCWFENYWDEYKGIHYYLTKERLLKDVMEKFCDALDINDKKEDVSIYKYDIPKYGIDAKTFIKFCENKKVYFTDYKYESNNNVAV